MTNGFSKFCFIRSQVIKSLKAIVPVTGEPDDGCRYLFATGKEGKGDCDKLFDWTDGNEAEGVQVLSFGYQILIGVLIVPFNRETILVHAPIWT